jgi:hypothetical protein
LGRLSSSSCWAEPGPPEKQTQLGILEGKENRAFSSEKEVESKEEDDSLIQKRNNLCSLLSTSCWDESGFTDEIHANWILEEGEAEKSESRITKDLSLE